MQQKMRDDKFYIICPDNDVSEETDKKRMLWSVNDIIKERQPLSRWREEYGSEVCIFEHRVSERSLIVGYVGGRVHGEDAGVDDWMNLRI